MELIQQYKSKFGALQTLRGKASISQSTNTMLCLLRAKPLAESGPLPTNQPSTTTFVTSSMFDDRRAFAEGKIFQSLTAFVQVEYERVNINQRAFVLLMPISISNTHMVVYCREVSKKLAAIFI